jgi:hypothetical protein
LVAENQSTDQMKDLQKELMALKNKQQIFEAKQEKSNKLLFQEIKRTNDHVHSSVMPTIDQTNKKITNIDQQISKLQDLNSSVNAVLSFVHFQMQNAAINQNLSPHSTDEMILEKEVYKHTLNGKLRDDNGYLQSTESNN